MQGSVEQLGAVFAASSDASFVVAASGEILTANDSSRAVFGYRPEELIGRSVEVLLPRSLRERHVAQRARHRERPGGRLMEGGGARYRGLHKLGHEFPIAVSLSPVTLSGEEHTVCAVRDASPPAMLEVYDTLDALDVRDERLRPLERSGRDAHELARDARAEHRDREPGFSTLFEGAAFPVALQEAPSGAYLEVNREWCALFGYSASEVRGRTSVELGINDSRTVRAANIARVLLRGTLRAAEVTLHNKAGARLEVVMSVRLVRIGGRDRFIVSYLDRTEPRHLEREIAHLIAGEQARIGAQLHEGLGQILTGAAFLTTAVLAEAKKQRMGFAPELARLRELIEESIATTRSIAQGLSPLIDARGSLREALRQLAQVSSTPGFTVAVSAGERIEREPPLHCRALLYRIADEAIRHARDHAGADRVEVSLRASEQSVELMVANAVRCIAHEKAELHGRLSLLRHRARSLGGRFTIAARAGGGQVLRCVLPQRL